MINFRSLSSLAKTAGLLLAAVFLMTQAPRQAAAIAGSCSLIDFKTVQFEDGGRRGWYLYIGGSRRFANMDVILEHRAGSRGDWIIEVVGCTKNALVLPLPTPFSIELAMRDLPRVRRIIVIGSNGSVRHKVPVR